MPEVFVGIGSNRRRYHYIARGLEALDERFGPLRISPVYESEPVGCKGSNFLNLVVGFDTDLSIAGLAAQLRDIEDDHGRDRSAPRFAPRTLDLDILTYGDVAGVVDGVRLPREEVLHNAFVLWPLAQLASDRVHPETGLSYEKLWAEYDKSRQRLWRVEFRWRGGVL